MTKVDFDKIINTNTLILLQAAQKLGIDFEILDWEKYKIKFFKNGKAHVTTKKTFGLNSSESIFAARNKYRTYQALKAASLPVLVQAVVKSKKDYQKEARPIGFPQVVKPITGEKGRNVYLNIKNAKEGQKAVEKILAVSDGVVIEPYFVANDYRFFVLGGKVIGVSQRKPPVIVADGKHSIGQLIEVENQRRLDYNKKVGRRMFNRMLIWDRIEWYITHQGLKLTEVLSKGKKIIVYPVPNFSTGGTVEAISLIKTHPSYLQLAIKAAQVLGLNICGVDILIKDLKKKATNKNCAVIEVNSDPGLRLHDWPNKGRPQKVAEKILKFIFEDKV